MRFLFDDIKVCIRRAISSHPGLGHMRMESEGLVESVGLLSPLDEAGIKAVRPVRATQVDGSAFGFLSWLWTSYRFCETDPDRQWAMLSSLAICSKLTLPDIEDGRNYGGEVVLAAAIIGSEQMENLNARIRASKAWLADWEARYAKLCEEEKSRHQPAKRLVERLRGGAP